MIFAPALPHLPCWQEGAAAVRGVVNVAQVDLGVGAHVEPNVVDLDIHELAYLGGLALALALALALWRNGV